MIRLGATDLTQGKAMVIGATGSIGSVCSRLLAQAIYDVTLVAPRPEKLIALKNQIEEDTPGPKITIATTPDDHVGEMDVIVTTTTAFGQRVIDITKCKPGTVICDVARPPDIEEWEAALRPDVLVIESGEDPAARRPGLSALRHRPAPQDRLRLPLRGRPAFLGRPFRGLQHRARVGTAQGQGDLPAFQKARSPVGRDA